MKKIYSLLLGICFMFLLCACNSSGVGESSMPETTKPSSPIYQPYSVISSSELDVLYNTEFYGEDMVHVDLSDKMILKTYRGICWENANLENQLAFNHQYGTSMFRYMIIGDEPFDVMISEKKVSIDETYDENALFLNDFSFVDTNVYIFDRLCHVKEVICFNSNYMEGILNYIVTNEGTFVKYYEKTQSEAIVFEENDFIIKADAYHAYRIDPETSHDKDGNLLYGFTTFKSFLSDAQLVNKYTPEKATE